MKNPVKYLKHIIKDPINTVAEADARKEELKPLLYVSIPLVLIGIGIFGLLLYAFLCFIIKRAKERFAAMTCDGCGEMMEIKTEEDMQKYVTYTIGSFSHQPTYSSATDSNNRVTNITVLDNVYVSVIFECTCPKCGQKNLVKYNIKPMSVEANSKYTSLDVGDKDTLEILTVAALRPVAALAKEHGVELKEVKDKSVSVKKSIGAATVDFPLSDATIEMLNDSCAIPVSPHSVYHKDYGKASIDFAHNEGVGIYPSVRLPYHRTVGEMAEGFFIRNELNGTIEKVVVVQE